MAPPAGVEIRLYRDGDYVAISSFECVDPRRAYTREAQDVIRKAPDDVRESAAEAVIVVAVDGERVVGAIVFGIDPQHRKTRTVFSIGVVRDRRRQGIGISLKRAALAELAATGYIGPVYSQVHKYNEAMNGLNRCLFAITERDPDSGKYLLTAVRPQLAP